MVKLYWQQEAERIYSRYTEDDENRDVVYLLQLWLARDERFETLAPELNFNLNKGILLHGPCGTGKTILLRIMQAVARRMRSEFFYSAKGMLDYCQQYQKVGIEVLIPERKHLFVDELGLISREAVQNFGNKLIIGDELVQGRYNMFNAGYLTHFTTNLLTTELQDFYNARTISRLREMCNFLPLDGRDRRGESKPDFKTKKESEKAIDRAQAARDYWATMLRQFKQFKAGASLDLTLPYQVYLKFSEVGLLRLTRQQQDDYLDKAKAQLLREREEMQRPLAGGKVQDAYKQAKLLVEAIRQGKLSAEQQNVVRSKAVSMAIEDFYKGISEREFESRVDEIVRGIK